MKSVITIFGTLFLCYSFANAQGTEKATRLSQNFIGFFSGHWSGQGAFGNGTKISADLNFEISLDSAWLTSTHHDRLPNRYAALSVWGLDEVSGEFIAYTFDNFHGHRKFVSDGWKEDKIVLTANEYHPQGGLVWQHFIYEKLSAVRFKMSYETSKNGIDWKLIDYLIFDKT